MLNELFNKVDPKKSDKDTEFLKQLIEVAVKNEHSEPELIVDLGSWNVARTLKEALEKLISSFKLVTKECYKKYLSNLKLGLDDYNLLLQYRTYKQCVDYYTYEYKILSDMIREYHAYLIYGFHLVDCLLGKERPEEDRYDFRIITSKVTYSNSKERK
jgi:hypothetical protein